MPTYKRFNVVRETCAAPGTGTITLLGASAGCRAFSSKYANGEQGPFWIRDQTGSNWEYGRHTYTGGTITRSAADVRDGSSGAGVLVNFSSGTQDVYVEDPAEPDYSWEPYIGLTCIGRHVVTGTVAEARGGNFIGINDNTGTTTSLTGISLQTQNNNAGGSVGNSFTTWIKTPVNAGTVTQHFGLYMEAQKTGGGQGTVWGIYQGGVDDQNHFASMYQTFGYHGASKAPVAIYNDATSNVAGQVPGLRVFIGGPGLGDTNPLANDYVAIYSEILASSNRSRIWGINTLCSVPATDNAEALAAEFDLSNYFADAPEPETVNHKIGISVAAGGSKMNSAAYICWAGTNATAWRHGIVLIGVGNSVAGSTLIKTQARVNVNYGFDLQSASISGGVLRIRNAVPAVLARNAANSADITVLSTNSSDSILIGSNVTIDKNGNVRAASFIGATAKSWTLQQDPGTPPAAETPNASRILKVGISNASLTVNGATSTGSVSLADSSGQYIAYTSGTGANSEAGWEFPTSAPTVPIMNFQFNAISSWVGKTGTDLTQQRIWIGWFSADPMAADITNSIHTMGFRLSVTTVGSCTVTNGGNSYTTPPSVAVNGGTFTVQATATALMGVNALTLTAAGSGYVDGTYTNQPMTGGGGTGATFDFVVSGGVVQTTAQNAASMVVNQAGSGYTTTPTCDFSAAFGSGATGTSTLKVVKIEMTNCGSGYTVNPTSVSFSGGGGSSAAASAVMGGAWHCVVGNGTAMAFKDAFTIAAADTRYVMRIDASSGTDVKFSINGTLVATMSANLPGASTSLAWYSNLRITSTNARSLRCSGLRIDQE